ncbi:MAG: hypothetical protein IJ085_08060 [Turicibacter sp.]|nr:hypothetical protein [Turicibacter sp.]
MKRLLTYLMLGFGVACFLFVGGIRPDLQLTNQAQQNISVLATTAIKFTDQVRTWLLTYTEESEPVMRSVDLSYDKDSFIDYDAALKIVDEIIKDIETLLTPEQKKAIEKEVNALYKQGILQEYKDQIGPRYYE